MPPREETEYEGHRLSRHFKEPQKALKEFYQGPYILYAVTSRPILRSQALSVTVTFVEADEVLAIGSSQDRSRPGEQQTWYLKSSGMGGKG